MSRTKIESIEYWSECLEEAGKKAAVICDKFHTGPHPCQLDIADMHVLVNLVYDYRAYSTLLARALAEPDEPTTLWQRIRNK